MVCNVLLPCFIGLHHRADHGFRHIPVIGQKLLRILGQAVAAVAEGRIIVEIADAGIIAHALDDIGGMQPFFLGVGVDFIEISHPDGQERIGKELDGLRFRRPRNEHRNLFLYSPFLHEGRKKAGPRKKMFLPLRNPYDNSGRIEIVIECLSFPEKFRRKEYGKGGVPLGNLLGVADGDGGLDHHQSLRFHPLNLGQDGLHRSRVEMAGDIIIIRRRRNDDELRLPVSTVSVQSGSERKLFMLQVVLNIGIRNGRLPAVHHIHLLRNHIHRSHLMMLGKKNGVGQSHIAGTGNGNFHNVSSLL